VTATPDEVEFAYKAGARMTHPDRFAGASREELSDASARFVQLTQARDLLLSVEHAPPPARYTPWPLRIWTVLLAPGLVLALTGAALPWPALLLVLPVVTSAVVLALTARFWRTTIALAALYAAATAVFATFGALLALEVLLPPIIAIVVLRRATARR
jgi:hypothetical protein